ncbi:MULTISPECIES: hypothetical protein [Flavobacteriaceae]|uniref:Tetratricopeptide repeat protein n=2 Tax=Flavobacteriaceae TaxID=49546 RepID=A0A4Y8ARM2_9FLAO|nr:MULTISPECIES: hypothetical protein [Flavobacteriaceae]TEW73027.1 hypothetical protein E2488_12610 [Gramella jeungdoensis]GGK47657.1 hypothetical protein GCM10007963_14920 [Lutibacter litoralis]
MNTTDFTTLMQNTTTIDIAKTEQLEAVINEYPYFQLARAIQLKGLNNTNSFKYNQALKKTAAYTVDRSVLFNFITSQNFERTSIIEIPILEEIDVIEPETIKTLHKKIITDLKPKSNPVTTETIKTPKVETAKNTTLEVLEVGKPLKFKSSEPHSFNEWMQLVSQKPIIRKENTKKDTLKGDKISLINKFIERKPKIKPVSKNTVNQDLSPESSSENESLMTETLAKVYLEQQKFENAIKAYRILSLKYPEKSGFFADQIKAIKILQKNKS